MKRTKNIGAGFRKKAKTFLKLKDGPGLNNRYLCQLLAKHFNTAIPLHKVERYVKFNALMGDVKVVSIPRIRESSRGDFYESDEWMRLRYQAIQKHGGLCQCCFSRPGPDNPLHVDHIKPRSKYPELSLDINNLQVLCKQCNLGKSAWDKTDWRRNRIS